MVEDVLTRPGALAGDDVDDAVRQDAFQEVHQFQDAEGRRARWLEDDRTAGGQGRCQFPGGHEEGEVPRDDLADDANRFVDDQAQRVVVQGRRPAVFAADDAGEVAEMVGCCRDVDGLRFPDGLAVVKVSMRASVSAFLSMMSAIFKRMACRFRGDTFFQAGKAAWAARTAALTSSCVASAQTDRTSPLAGLMALKVEPSLDGTQRPLIYKS